MKVHRRGSSENCAMSGSLGMTQGRALFNRSERSQAKTSHSSCLERPACVHPRDDFRVESFVEHYEIDVWNKTVDVWNKSVYV